MAENTKKIFKLKDFRDFEVVEDKSKAEYIQILDTKGVNTVMRIEKGSIDETLSNVLKYYYNFHEILDIRYLKYKTSSL